MSNKYVTVTRLPDEPCGYFWAKKHEPTHAVDKLGDLPECGHGPQTEQSQWVERSSMCPVTCEPCREKYGLPPLHLKPGDYHFGLFIDYGLALRKDQSPS